MVLGDHGRRVLYPMSLSQQFAAFPWKRLYGNSMYFRAFCATGLTLATGWAYIILKGVDVSFTPYSAVHHSIGHKFAHDLEHQRYPIDHKKH
ncbi:unnamed protein product [Brachionus calyciflorus]|uniref:Uncharacterized protein n=1 Tax=Brachionus calyciflorus TaxID=104777 RepID=A0A814C2S7_9BILA|nr:unnamed protein product [Brachionus calyciflorus]